MYSKLLCCSALALLFVGFSTTNTNAEQVDTQETQNASIFGSAFGGLDGFLNIKAAHERRNDYAFGPKNGSAVAFNPVLGIGKFTADADFYFGEQFSFVPPMHGLRNMSRTVPVNTLQEFNKQYKNLSGSYKTAMEKNIYKEHFYRAYSRLTYQDDENNFRVVIGDTTTRNQIGNQHAIGGMGISIFRQGGNGSVINASCPIVLTRPSKIECKMGDDILAVRVLGPGTYYIDDLPEEARIPGVKLKISDQLNRSETLQIDYFSGYGMPKGGEDDFDISLIWEASYDIDDPCRVTYANDPRFSTNYRRGISDDFTVGVGFQFYKSSYLIDATTIHNTSFGKLSPNVSFSHEVFSDTNESSKNGVAAGFYYETPTNEYGIMFDTFIGVKSKDFGDQRRGEEATAAYNAFMDKYFPNDNLKDRFMHKASESSSSRQIIARLYSKPIFGITPSFTFNGVWSKSERLREYTISLTTKIFDKVTFTATAGLTYDDPYRGINQQAPDRRLTVALTVPIGDVKLQGTYTHHDDQRLRGYGKIQYNPSEIEGLEIVAEDYFKPGYSNPQASLKYDGKYFNLKLEESITNTYKNSAEGKVSHVNQQRAFFGTSISPSKIRAYQPSNVNVLRSMKDYKEFSTKDK